MNGGNFQKTSNYVMIVRDDVVKQVEKLLRKPRVM